MKFNLVDYLFQNLFGRRHHLSCRFTFAAQEQKRKTGVGEGRVFPANICNLWLFVWFRYGQKKLLWNVVSWLFSNAWMRLIWNWRMCFCPYFRDYSWMNRCKVQNSLSRSFSIKISKIRQDTQFLYFHIKHTSTNIFQTVHHLLQTILVSIHLYLPVHIEHELSPSWPPS